MLPDESAQRHTGDQRHREAGEHDGDRTRGLFTRHQAGSNGGADREKHTVRQPGQYPRHHQSLVTRRLPGHQVAHGEQCHQRQQQGFAWQFAGQRRQHRGTNSNTQRVQADQQAR